MGENESPSLYESQNTVPTFGRRKVESLSFDSRLAQSGQGCWASWAAWLALLVGHTPLTGLELSDVLNPAFQWRGMVQVVYDEYVYLHFAVPVRLSVSCEIVVVYKGLANVRIAKNESLLLTY